MKTHLLSDARYAAPLPGHFDLQLFAEDDDLTKLTPEELVAMVKSTRKEAAGYRSRITVLEGEKTKLVEERDSVKGERDTLKTEKEKREADELTSQKKFEDLAKIEREKREAAEKKHADELAAAQKKAADDLASRNALIVRTKAEAALKDSGALNPAIAKLFDVEKLTLDENGEVLDLPKWVEEAKAKNPELFKSETAPPDPRRPVPPTPPKPLDPNDKSKNVDFRTLSDADFAERERALLAGIGQI